jgi:sulfhydrogenase subunit gamma (sulfur reductase)
MSLQLQEIPRTPSIYLPAQALIADVHPVTHLEKLFTVQLPEGVRLDHEPGQFVEVSLLGIGEAPFSICSSPSRSNRTFELCIRRVGDITNTLHTLKPGDSVGIRGPFGQGFPIRRFRGKDLLFVLGGLGLAPARSLIQQVLDERGKFGRVIILYGARTPTELVLTDELTQWSARDDVEVNITVDRASERWTGNVGVVTTLLPGIEVHIPNTIAITIGPPVMYRFVLMELLGKGIREGNIWLSLERRMKCGVGKCGHCQINHLYTCHDGPCFSYDQIKHVQEGL